MVNFVFLSVYFYSVPNLRFREFHTEWEKIQIGNLIKERKEYTSDFEKYPLYSFTIESGITPKSDRYERSFLVKKEGDLFKIVHQNDFVMNPMNLRFGALNYSKINQTVSVSGYYDIFTIDACKYNEFWNAYLKTPRMLYTYNTIATGSLVEKKRVYFKQLKELKMCIPSEMEKNKINEFINLLNERIQTQNKIIDTLSSQKKQIRNLIFKDIHKNANCCIQDYVIYEQPQKYIVHSTDYVSHGKDYTPVLTANQSFILGYTLEKDGIYKKGDCIIFDDFTNENKYVDFPFKVKSSALKILQTKEGLMLKFFYEYLQFLNFESTDHKRHYLSEVAVTDISVPNLKEQTFLCKIFTSFDNKLKNEEALLEKYRLQKQFLLNNLFI